MCGIIAYIGSENTQVAEIAQRALKDLEYRGYDASGIAVVDTYGKLHVHRSVGVASRTDRGDIMRRVGHIVLGHTRWATHGKNVEENAHPHVSGKVAVVHNGIIENFAELRGELEEKGFVFRSQTDTEVIPHLITYHMRQGFTFSQAFVLAGKALEGAFAVAAICAGEEMVLGMRRGSPLVIGRGGGEYFLASHEQAFSDTTRVVAFVGDGEYVRVTALGAERFRLDDDAPLPLEWGEATWSKEDTDAGPYEHRMLKEIFEQPLVVARAASQDDEELREVAAMISSADRVFLVGCGTAHKMAQLGEFFLSKYADVCARAVAASEFAPLSRFVGEDSLLIGVSQSGETADTLAALGEGATRGAKVVSLLNVLGTRMGRVSDRSLMVHAGAEIAVASTKAAIAQATVLFLLASAVADTLTQARNVLRVASMELEGYMDEWRATTGNIADAFTEATDMLIIGRGAHMPIAFESAIKIQEVSYVHAEGFAAGELKHGPIALVSTGMPVIAFVPNDETKRAMESNIEELRARGAVIIGIGPEANERLFDHFIKVPDLGPIAPLASLIPVQMLAYRLAVSRGLDPDKPRNLAKSVTVL